jgi:hypothetical protein
MGFAFNLYATENNDFFPDYTGRTPSGGLADPTKASDRYLLWFEALRRVAAGGSQSVSNFAAWQCPAALILIGQLVSHNRTLYSGDILSYGYNYANLGNNFPEYGASMKVKMGSVLEPSFTIVVADSLSDRLVAKLRGDVTAPGVLWGSVIAPKDYASGAHLYLISDQHRNRGDVLFVDSSARAYRAKPLNDQIRAGPNATPDYWWDADKARRSNRDGLFAE